MAIDARKNFCKSTFEGASGINAAATEVTVADASNFPDPASGNYNLVIWNITDYANPSDAFANSAAEIVRATGLSTNTFTITRAQESTTARAFNTTGKTYAVAMTLTAKTVTDIETDLAGKMSTTPTTIELGHASDTTLSRSAAGVIAVEGNVVPSPGSQAEGDILYRGASSWSRLAKGTAAQVLTMNAGATAPEWAAAGGGGESKSFIPGRLFTGSVNGASFTYGAGASNDFIPVGRFADSTNVSAIGNVKVPSGKTGISSMIMIVSGDGIGGNAYLEFLTSRVDTDSAGTYQTDLTDTITTYAITASAAMTFITIPSGAYNALTMDEDDVISVSIRRNAADGNDTHNTTLELFGVLITWS